jgi:Fe(3+) dicitrate transport protein
MTTRIHPVASAFALALMIALALAPGARVFAQSETENIDPYLTDGTDSITTPAPAEIAPVAPRASTGSKASTAESPVDLDPMMVISKAPGRYEKLTGTASRLDSLALRRMRPTGTQEALEKMPGVQGSADDGFGNSRLSVGIRGLNPRRSAHALILEDGIPIAPALYLYPNMYYNPPAERIDEIELIKGAAAIQYGPQTMGGVINYITRRPRRIFGGLAQVTGGQNGYGSVYAEVGGWGTPTLHPEIQLLYKRGDGFRENNGFEQYNATLKLNYLASARDAWYLKLNADIENTDATYTGLTEYSFRTDPSFNPKKYDTFDIQRYALDLIRTRELTNGSRVTKYYGSAFFRDWWRENDSLVTAANWRSHVENGTPLNFVQDLNANRTIDMVRVGAGDKNFGNLRDFFVLGAEDTWKLRHALPSGREGTLELGARVYWERFLDRHKVGNSPWDRTGAYYTVDTAGVEHAILGAVNSHYETLALALYTSEEVAFGRLTVKPGMRFEVFEQERIDLLNGSRYQDKASYAWLPGIGANYTVNEAVHLFGGVHRGYSPPSSGTLQVVNFGQQATSGGLDVAPEKSWNSELGVRTAHPWFALEASAFHLYIEDVVATGLVGTTFKNLGAAQTYGLETELTVKGSKHRAYLPDARVAYTWLRSEVLEGEVPSSQTTAGEVSVAGNRLPYNPEHTVAAEVWRDFAFGLTLSGSVKYVSWVYTDYENLKQTENRGDTGPLDGYMLFDASASYAFAKRYRVFVNGKNLLDEVYAGSRLHSNPYRKTADQMGILPGPRRQINAGASVNF